MLAAALNAAVEADLIARSPGRGIMVLPPACGTVKGTLAPENLVRLADEVPGRYIGRSS